MGAKMGQKLTLFNLPSKPRLQHPISIEQRDRSTLVGFWGEGARALSMPNWAKNKG